MDTNLVLILNTNNATSTSLATGQANFLLPDVLRFDTKNPQIAVNTFSYTNFFLNISTALANNLIYYSDDVLDAVKYSITVPDGSYSIESLNTYVGNSLTSAGHTGLFEILGDYSQNKAYIKWSATLTGWFLSFSAGTCYTILGMTLNQFVPAGKSNVANEVNYATNVAAFNSVESVNVKTNLCNNFYLGATKSSVLYQSIPDVTPGSVKVDSPTNLLWSNSEALRSGISEIIVNLTDQNDSALVMTENFSVVLQIKY